jgi:2-methylcitrate dehydratase PrpD
VWPALTHSEGHTGGDLLAAQICAVEIAARVNTAVALGPLRGQMATHVHLLGATAAKARLEGLDPDPYAQALGFALSYPARALYPGFLGSDAKVLCASWPIRMGLEAVDAVRAGLRGNPSILEGRQGFLRTYADVAVPAFLEGLGERWHTETNSYKVYPACAYIDSVLDATLELVRRHDIRAEAVAAVDVHATVFTIGMDVQSAPYLAGPDSLVPTLSFSTPYNVACAIRDRELTPDHYTRPRIADRATWDLAAKVRLHLSDELTTEALLATAPIGAALRAAGAEGLDYVRHMARDRAEAIVDAVGRAADGKIPDLSESTKAVGATVRIETLDGGSFQKTVKIPAGAAGSGDWKTLRGLMREKFVTCAARVVGEERAGQAADLIEGLDELDEAGVARLVQLNVAQDRTGRLR